MTLEAITARTAPSRAPGHALGSGLDELFEGKSHRAVDSVRTIAVLERVIALIDELIASQINEILHHPIFHELEARWLGVQYLVDQVDASDAQDAQTLIKVYDVEWTELAKDLEFSPEFSQSQLFRRVYDEEFGAPGGQPFGLLLGDYEIGARAESGRGGDLATLRAVSETAAAAFAPFIAQAHASLFGLEHIRDLQRQLDLRLRFDSPDMLRWKDLRATDEARFLGLTVPRVLARLPYVDDGAIDRGFRFCEDVSAADGSGYCWGSSIWALGGVAIRSFQESGWFADVRGVRPGQHGAGLVHTLPAADYGTDSPGIAVRAPLEISITDETERELAEHGFICLCPDGDGSSAAFYTIPSLSRPTIYTTNEATANSSLSAMLPHLLCVSRFAHAMKVIGRDLIGASVDASTLHARLNDWIRKFVVEGSSSSAEQRARFPLSAANILLEAADASGHYNCVLHLQPHMQFDQVVASMTLKTRLEKRR